MFGLCMGLGIQQQVLPLSKHKYAPSKDAILDEKVISDASRPRTVVKTKPGTEVELSERSRLKKLEEEIFLLTLDLHFRYSPQHEFEQQLLQHESVGELQYDCDSTSAQATSDLVLLLRKTIHNYQSKQGKLPPGQHISPEVVKALAKLLKDYHEYPPGTFPSSAYNNNCFTSIGHALMITDVLLTACYDDIVALNSNITPQHFRLVSPLVDLIQQTLHLGSYLHPPVSEEVALSLGHVALKTSCLLATFAQYWSTWLSSQHSSSSSSSSLLSEVLPLVQVSCQLVNVAKSLCGEESLLRYLSTLHTWQGCETLLALFASSSAIDARLQSMTNLWTNRLLQAYLTTIPTAADLLFALQHLESMEGDWREWREEEGFVSMILAAQYPVPRGSPLLGALDGGHEERMESSSLVPRRQRDMHRLPLTVHVRFLWTGILRILHLPSLLSPLSSSPSPASLPGQVGLDREPWLESLYDILSFLLQQGHPTALSQAVLVCHMMVKLTWSMPRCSPLLDYLVDKVVSRLHAFTQSIRRGQWRSPAETAFVSLTLEEAERVSTPRHHASPPGQPVLSHASPRPAGATTSTPSQPLEICLDTPFKSLHHRSSSPSPRLNPPLSQEMNEEALPPDRPLYCVGDKVDALFTVQNGSKRWFPATVTAVWGDHTYALLFDDGDRVEHQAVHEIRVSKRGGAGGAGKRTTGGAAKGIELDIPSPVPSLGSPNQALSPPLTSGSGGSVLPLRNAPSPVEREPHADMHRLVSLANIPQVEVVGEEDDGDKDSSDSSEEDRVYEIPSIFDGYHRPASKPPQEELVPRMHFGNLPLTSSMPHSASGQSLSGALLRDASSPRASDPSPSSSAAAMFVKSSARTPLYQTHRSTHRSARTATGGGGGGGVGGAWASELDDSMASLDSSLGMLTVASTSSLSKPPRPTPPPPQHQSTSASAGHNFNLNFNQGVLMAMGEETAVPMTTQTRLTSWRGGEETSRTSRSHLRSSAPPPSAASGGGGGGGGRSSARHSEEITPVHSMDNLALFHPPTYAMLVQIHGLLALWTLSQCLNSSGGLDPDRCQYRPSTPSRGGKGQDEPCAGDEMAIPPVFVVRDFLEVCASPTIHTALALALPAMPTPQTTEALHRVLKLLHPAYFSNCLSGHLQSQGGRKLGEGGFGSVYCVLCTCGRYMSLSPKTCYGCIQSSRRQSTRDGPYSPFVPSSSTLSSSIHTCRGPRPLAIKRLPRERSMHDISLLTSLYQEAAALDRLSDCLGICRLEEYGVVGSEYWLVLEAGGGTVLDWRHRHGIVGAGGGGGGEGCSMSPLAPSSPPPRRPPAPLSRSAIALYLLLFNDLALTLQVLHQRDIAHFDVKLDNVLLREDPDGVLDYLVTCQALGQPSGVLFLADFGEALVDVSKSSLASRQRSRGTLSIQSPEMLCINEYRSSPGEGDEEDKDGMEGRREDGSGKGRRSSSRERSRPGHRRHHRHAHRSVPSRSLPYCTGPSSSSSTPSSRQVSPCPTALGALTSSPPDQRCDLWSLGCLLAELLSGHSLFGQQPWPELYTKLCLSSDASLWKKDVVALLSTPLSSLSSEEAMAIHEIVFGLLQRQAERRLSASQVVQQVGEVIATHFQKEVDAWRASTLNASPTRSAIDGRLRGDRKGMSVLSYSHSSEEGDLDLGQGPVPSQALPSPLLPSTQAVRPPLLEGDGVAALSPSLVPALESLAVNWSVVQVSPRVWMGRQSSLAPLLSSRSRGKEASHFPPLWESPFSVPQCIPAVSSASLPELPPCLTWPTLFPSPCSLRQQNNASLFASCLQVDGLIASTGLATLPLDRLADVLGSSRPCPPPSLHPSRQEEPGSQSPGLVSIHISWREEKAPSRQEEEEEDGEQSFHLAVPSFSREDKDSLISYPWTDLRDAVFSLVSRLASRWQHPEEDGVVVLSLQEESPGRVSPVLFSTALVLASLLTTYPTTAAAPDPCCGEQEALCWLGRFQRTWMGMDALFDRQVVQLLLGSE